MKLINTNDVYYDNDFEKWYFENDEDFENAQVVDDNYVKVNQELKQQITTKNKEVEGLKTRVSEKDKENFNLLEQNEELTYRIANVVGEITKLENIIKEKDKEIEKLNLMIKTLPNHDTEIEQQIRKQVCDMARKKIVGATCYDTEEEVRNVIYDLNASEALEILDEIEKGEHNKDEELAIRKQFAEEIYNYIIDNWDKLMSREGRWQNFSGTCIDLKNDLEKSQKMDIKKENRNERIDYNL